MAAEETVDQLYIELHYVREEHSKDSSHVTIFLKLEGGVLTYTAKGSGFRFHRDEEKSCVVSNDMMKKIMAYIEEIDIFREVMENRETDGVGISTYVKLSLKMNEKKGSILIEGMSNLWGADDYLRKKYGKKIAERGTNIEHITLLRKCEALLNFLEAILEGCNS